MPNADDSVEPLKMPSPALRQKRGGVAGTIFSCTATGGVAGGAVELAGVVLGSFGVTVDRTVLHALTAAASGVAAVASTSAIVKFCFRLSVLLLLESLRVIPNARYLRLRNLVFEAYEKHLQKE